MKPSAKKLFLIGIVVIILVFLGLRIYPMTGKATLSWRPNTETDLAGYKIYYGTLARTGDCPPGGYSDKLDLGKTAIAESPSYIINNLEIGRTYYFSITSYDNSGKESCFSGEVKKTIGNPIIEQLKIFIKRIK